MSELTQKDFLLNLIKNKKSNFQDENIYNNFISWIENCSFTGYLKNRVYPPQGTIRFKQSSDSIDVWNSDVRLLLNIENIKNLNAYESNIIYKGKATVAGTETVAKDIFLTEKEDYFLLKIGVTNALSNEALQTYWTEKFPLCYFMWSTDGVNWTKDTVNNPQKSLIFEYDELQLYVSFSEPSFTTGAFGPNKYTIQTWINGLRPLTTSSVVIQNIPLTYGLYENIDDVDTLLYYIKNNELEETTDYNLYTVFQVIKKEDLLNLLKIYDIESIYLTEEDLINNRPVEFEPEPEPPYVPEQSDGVKTQTGQTQNKVNNQGGTGDKTSETVNSKPNVPIGSVGTSGSVYVLNWNQLTKVQGEIWNPNVWESILSLNYKPGDTIQGGSLYPFNIPDYVTTSSSTNNKVVLGTYEIDFNESTDGVVRKINPVSDTKIELVENYKIDGIYGGFLDFEPYTKMTLWLPYIGFKSVSPQHIYNKTINIYYNIDFSTGQCKCILETEGNPIYEWTSSMGAEISFNSSNFGQIKQNAVLGTIGAAVSIGSGIATGGASTLSSIGKGAGEMVSTVGNTLGAMSFQSMGSTGSSLERFDPQGCFLIIECVESAAPDGYNHTKGRPSLITTQLKNLKGYTEIGVSHFEIPEATESEKSEIENIFKEGVIIR